MRRAAPTLCAFLAGCSFSPAPLVGGGTTIDAPISLPADAMIDVLTFDVAPPDATPDLCPSPSAVLPLDTEVTSSVPSGGTSLFNPICDSGGSGAETFFHVDLTGQTGSNDFVAEVDDKAATLDAILDMDLTCGSTPTGNVEVCTDAGSNGGGEFTVMPAVTNGRKYVIVDSFWGSGSFKVRAWIRPVRTVTQSCDVNLRTSRCTAGTFCLDGGAGGVCTASAVVTEALADETACEAGTNYPTGFPADGVWQGTMSSSADVDWVKLVPPVNGKVRLAVFTGNSVGCAADLKLSLYNATSCTNIDNGSAPTPKTDDDSGLGPCPFLDENVVTTGVTYVKIERGIAGVTAMAPYTMTIDYHN